ncbi:hypothetical protein WN943_009740 [Citrus x changshan-huyou]
MAVRRPAAEVRQSFGEVRRPSNRSLSTFWQRSGGSPVEQSAISEARLGSRRSTTEMRAQLEDAATFDDSNRCPAWRRSRRSMTARQMAFDGNGFCLFPILATAVVMKS